MSCHEAKGSTERGHPSAYLPKTTAKGAYLCSRLPFKPRNLDRKSGASFTERIVDLGRLSVKCPVSRSLRRAVSDGHSPETQITLATRARQSRDLLDDSQNPGPAAIKIEAPET